MLIGLIKFGDILTSREAGREAYAAFLPTFNALGADEEITIDFQGVSVLTPSWADEFIRPIAEKYGEKVSFVNTANPSVQAALRFAIPKLDLTKIKVFEDKIVFDELNENEPLQVMMFPYSDEEALRILKDNKVKKIRIQPVDTLSDFRLKVVIQMLNKAGIESILKRSPLRGSRVVPSPGIEPGS